MEPSNNTELLSGIRSALDRLYTLVGTGDESRDRMGKHAERLEERIQRIEQFIDGSSMSCAQMSQRLEKTEKALSEEMAKAREVDDILVGVVKKVGYVSEAPPDDHIERWCIGAPSNPVVRWQFDPKASPTGIPFSVALEYLKTGREVRRKGWALTTRRIQPNGPGGVGGLYVITGASWCVSGFQPALSDMLATDWEVVPQQPFP